MGLIVKGVWQADWYDTAKNDGEFIREDAQFRHWITADGAAGPSGKAGFKAEAGRYHLYVSLACPWAHRTLIFRVLKQLETVVSVSVVEPHMLEHGWEYGQTATGTTDCINNVRYHHQLYTLAQPDYSGRVTVPVLWDKQTRSIVNNESAEIIRMFNSAFNQVTGNQDDYYPVALRTEIDAINQTVYDYVNNGVYRCGFATRQQAYERAFDRLFATLDELDQRLAQQRYLVGADPTEADWRLFTTLIRFDAVYYGHFKCDWRRISDYPQLSNYLRDLYQYPGIADTVDFEHIKQHYYYSHDMINPTRIVPKGPELNLLAVHDRQRFAQE